MAAGFSVNTGNINTATAFTGFNFVIVTSSSGSYAPVPPGNAVKQNAFSFNPFAAVTPLWIFTNGGLVYSFELDTIQTPVQPGDNTLTLRGLGILKITGFVDTPASWLFTAAQNSGTFSFSSTDGASPPPPTCTITNITNGTVFARPTNLLIAASATASNASIANVQFLIGSDIAGVATTSPYKVITNNLPAGSYVLTAVATDSFGSKGTSAPVNITVRSSPPVVFITSPASNTVYATPGNVTVQATASDATNVEFYFSSTLVGSDNASPYAFTTNALPAGIYSFEARAYNSEGVGATSPPVPVTVVLAAPIVFATNGLRVAGSALPLTISAVPGLRYALEASSAVFPSNWVALVTNTAASNSITFSNSITGYTNRFFRARLLPNP